MAVCSCFEAALGAAAIPTDDLLGGGPMNPIGNTNTRTLCLLAAAYIGEQVRTPIMKRSDAGNASTIGTPSHGVVLSMKEALRQLVVNEYGSRGSVCRDGVNFRVRGVSEVKDPSVHVMHACEHLCVPPVKWDERNFSHEEVQNVFDTTSALNGVMLLLKEIGDLRRTAAIYRQACRKVLRSLRKETPQKRAEQLEMTEDKPTKRAAGAVACEGNCRDTHVVSVLMEVDKVTACALNDPYASSGTLRTAMERCREMIVNYRSRVESVPRQNKVKKLSMSPFLACSPDSSASLTHKSTSSDGVVDMCDAAHAPTITITSGRASSLSRAAPKSEDDATGDQSRGVNPPWETVKRGKRQFLPELPQIRSNPLSQPPTALHNVASPVWKKKAAALLWEIKRPAKEDRRSKRNASYCGTRVRATAPNSSLDIASAVAVGGNVQLSQLCETANSLIVNLARVHLQREKGKGVEPCCPSATESHEEVRGD